jgi:hypothetical protein
MLFPLVLGLALREPRLVGIGGNSARTEGLRFVAVFTPVRPVLYG